MKCPRNATYKSKTIQNQIIGVLKDYVQEKIVNEVKKTKYFSVMADEAGDISGKQQMAFILRHLNSENVIKEEFLSFIHCEDGTSGQAISEYLIKTVQELGNFHFSPKIMTVQL